MFFIKNLSCMFIAGCIFGWNIPIEAKALSDISIALSSGLYNKQALLNSVESHICEIDLIEAARKSLLQQDSLVSTIDLSIIIDCFGAGHLKDLLASIYSQEVNFKFEVFCCVNPTNKSFLGDVISYKKKYNNLLEFYGARVEEHNNIFLKTNGKVILYLSSADILPPTFLQRLFDYYQFTGAEVIEPSNIISLSRGEFSAVPRHDRFYTSIDMGSNSRDIYAFLSDADNTFLWGLKNGCKAFTKRAWINSGGLIGREADRSFNLALSMLLKGYNFNTLSNSFIYQYYSKQSWFVDIFNVDTNRQIEMIKTYYPELLLPNTLKENILHIKDMHWQEDFILRNIIAAYQAECSNNYLEAYNRYALVIKYGACSDKILLKCIRSYLNTSNQELDLSVIERASCLWR